MGMPCLSFCYEVSNEFIALGDEPKKFVKFCLILIVHFIVVGTENMESNAEIIPSWFYLTFLRFLCC